MSGDISDLHVSLGGTGVAFNITNFGDFASAFTTGPFANCFYRDKIGYLLHRGDVGGRGPYLSWRGYTGPGYSIGSLQVVSSASTNQGYADIDDYNTQDLWNIVRHNMGVVGGIFHRPVRITDPRPLPVPSPPPGIDVR